MEVKLIIFVEHAARAPSKTVSGKTVLTFTSPSYNVSYTFSSSEHFTQRFTQKHISRR